MSSSYWLIISHETHGMDVLTVELFDVAGSLDGQRMLPVFSYSEEAEAFLEALRQDGPTRGKFHATPANSGWRIRETSRGELVSLLYGTYAGVRGILFDPSPEIDTEMAEDLVGVDRESFVDRLLGRGRAWFHDRQSKTAVPEEVDLLSPRQRGRPGLRPEPDTTSPAPSSPGPPTSNRRKRNA
jgi:hypothetical protein